MIVTVGFNLTHDTIGAAKANPNTWFIGVDQAPCVDPTGADDTTFACKGDAKTLLPKYISITYQEDQAGYLAGMVAASVSKSGTIAAIGGTSLCAPCVRYIQGYALGAQSINSSIRVKTAYVTGDFSSKAFGDPVYGKQYATSFIAQNKPDVIFQVAGATGNGILDAACAAGIYGIGVDVDQFLSYPNADKCIVTSAEKHLTNSVEATIKTIAAATAVGGPQVFNAANDGIGISDFHDKTSLISADLTTKLADRPRGHEGRHPGDLPGDRLRRRTASNSKLDADPSGPGRQGWPAHSLAHVWRPPVTTTPASASFGPAAVSAPALEMRGITKRYPGVVANDRIDLVVRPGEIHALLGENGAGKSTLMNILYGLARPDEGQILLDGKAVRISRPVRRDRPRDQHGPPALHARPGPHRGREHPARRRDDGQPDLSRPGRGPPPDPRAGRPVRLRDGPGCQGLTLSVGWQQRVEILKALYRQARILVLDEPTAVLTPQETEEIFAVLKRLAAEGHSIIFISHKLYEVLEIADRITVIRRGRVVGYATPAETNEGDLAEMMVGREVQLTIDRGESHPGKSVLEVELAAGRRRPWPARSSAASTSRSGPARSWGSPGSPATARTSWSRRSSACVGRRPAGSSWRAAMWPARPPAR